MSMDSWTTNAYGVTENDINIIQMSNVWPIFMAIQMAADKNRLLQALHEFCEDEGVSKDELSDENKDDFISTYYEKTTNIYVPDARAVVLADLVARNLHVNLNEIIIEKNEEGNIIVGIGLYYPWNMPEPLKNATQEDYEAAFINAYALFGIDGHSCCIEEQTMEDWG